MTKSKAKTAPLLIFSLVLLFNPNIGVIDILPDFIAYFIFTKMLTRAADSAPYFEEARECTQKLAWLSLAKIPAFLLILYIRSKNTFDRDVFPMVSLVFATLEIILLVSLIKNLSSALFHLGERGTAASLILPFPTSKSGKRTMRPEDLRTFSVIFAVAKCALYALPEFLLLSGTTSDGTLKPAPMIRFYPWCILAALAIGFTLGGIWLSRCKKYAHAAAEEGKFNESLELLSRADAAESYDKRSKLRLIGSSLILLVLSAVLTLRLALKETDGINLLPAVFFALAFVLAVRGLGKFTAAKLMPVFISGGTVSLLSILGLASLILFNDKFDYSSLALSQDAKAAYLPVIILAGLELLAFAALAIFGTMTICRFIEAATGVSPTDPRYSRTERGYHKELKRRTAIMCVLAILTELTKFTDILLKFWPKTVYTDVNNTPVAVTSSLLPWFGVVVIASSIAYIAYTIYYIGIIKEECELKYTK